MTPIEKIAILQFTIGESIGEDDANSWRRVFADLGSDEIGPNVWRVTVTRRQLYDLKERLINSPAIQMDLVMPWTLPIL